MEAAEIVEEGRDGTVGMDAGERLGDSVGEVVGDGKMEEGKEMAMAVDAARVRGGGDDAFAEEQGVDELDEFGPRAGVAEGESVTGVVLSEEGEYEG